MPAFVACPGCGIKLAVPETLLGNRVRCSSCANVFEARADAVPPGPPAVPEGLTRGAGDLPEAPLDEPPPRRERPRDSYDYYPDYNEYDDYDDRERRERRRRYRRRDLAPHRGGMVLAFGILSLVLPFSCGFLGAMVGVVLGPIAWIMAMMDLKQIKEGVMDPDGEGNTRGGLICGIIGTIFSGLFFLGCGAYIIFAIALSSMQ